MFRCRDWKIGQDDLRDEGLSAMDLLDEEFEADTVQMVRFFFLDVLSILYST